MPNKTIYVSDGDLPVFQRAQELAGDNLSKAISKALHRFVDVEEGKLEGFREITVKVGVGQGRRQRFVGVQLVEWGRSSKDRTEQFTVYRSRTGKYVVHCERSAAYVHEAGPDGDAKGWRKHFSSDQVWGQTPATATLDVFDTLEELRDTIPGELYAQVTAAATIPDVEDLDI